MECRKRRGSKKKTEMIAAKKQSLGGDFSKSLEQEQRQE
jgi:hypothetical protein